MYVMALLLPTDLHSSAYNHSYTRYVLVPVTIIASIYLVILTDSDTLTVYVSSSQPFGKSRDQVSELAAYGVEEQP